MQVLATSRPSLQLVPGQTIQTHRFNLILFNPDTPKYYIVPCPFFILLLPCALQIPFVLDRLSFDVQYHHGLLELEKPEAEYLMLKAYEQVKEYSRLQFTLDKNGSG